ncbi:tRNA (N(6)-L-threonylcarbamoyladenosine(37)-C(2))-methylthiotransferase, partial [Candidatus Pacearchaeota archaeon]|nr:tRNA (N(6)-L-threonylcarbamoyladenosine(37)-C(2))-methylthiotransferase [Candidatus Pacearchaeota archaeon]
NIAEIIIINSCIVKGKTESKIKRRIQDLSKLYKNKLFIISGCMPETDFNSLKKINPDLLFLGIHHIKDISQIISDYFDNEFNSNMQKEYLSERKEEKILLPKIPENKLISIIQISEGCNGQCSFCKTRLAKGSLFSYPSDKIIKQIENDLQQGAKEIWLTSQDCASYGIDQGKPLLPELLNEILKLKHNFKLRLGMMNPNNVYPIMGELIQIYKSPKMYKFIHIPIQSASNNVLRNMKRPYEIKKVEKIIKQFKKEFPDIVIATDIITAYPTETEQDNQSNLEFIKEFKPDVLNLSKFSSHRGTEAGKLKPLDIKIINRRASELMQIHRETAEKNKQKYKDKTISIFINKKISENLYEARDDNYNIILISSKDKSILGKNLDVQIKQVGVHHLIGEMI